MYDVPGTARSEGATVGSARLNCRFKCRVKIARTGTRIWLSVLAPFDRDSVCSAVIDTSLGDREISRHGVPARIMILQRDRMPFGEGLELV
jgi:hypothetical protein